MENKELSKLHSLMQFTVFGLLILDLLINVYYNLTSSTVVSSIVNKIQNNEIFSNPINIKLLTVLVLLLTGIGTSSKKDLEFNYKKQVVLPLGLGLLLIFSSLLFIEVQGERRIDTVYQSILYTLFSLVGTIMTLVGIDNVSKYIKSNFGKDKWNVEGESFDQERVSKGFPYVTIPMEFYWKKRINKGFINIDPFRATLVLGNPGSGKTYSVIDPFIRQVIAMGFSTCIYDFKTPNQANVAYYHYRLAKQRDQNYKHKFNVINLDDISKSKRVNPLHPKYLKTLAQATEISTSILYALKKGEDSGGGSGQFFTQSGINFLTSCVYFLAKYEDGKYSSLPHLLAFLNRNYDEIFTCLFSNEELESLISPFKSAHEKKVYEQLEGQIGTLKIFLSRLDNYETRWVFSADDINLKISDKEDPQHLILASSTETKGINSALYSLVFNRLNALINTQGNLPSAIIADEFPTIYIHKVQELIATARSNKVAVFLGIQEISQLEEEYGAKMAKTIQTVVSNIIVGTVKGKDTIQWLVTIFGKVKQQGEGLNIDRSKTSQSLNERMEDLIPSGKIANLKTGELVGMVAQNAQDKTTGLDYTTSAINCRVTLDNKAIKNEQENYIPTPTFYDFGTEEEKKKILIENFRIISEEVETIVQKVTK